MVGILFLLFFLGFIILTHSVQNGKLLNQDFTYEARGILAIAIIIHHMAQVYNEPLSNQFISLFFFSYVGPFYLFSGYGIAQGLLTKDNYMIGFLGKRMRGLLIPFLIAFLTELVCDFFLTGNPISAHNCLNVFRDCGWFLKSIVIIYVGAYFIFRFIKNLKFATVYMMFFLIIYSVVCILSKKSMIWWGDIFSFELGLIIGFNKNFFSEKLKVNMKKFICFTLCIIFICWLYIWVIRNYISISGGGTLSWLIGSISYSLLFCCLSLCISWKKNNIFEKIGKMSLELYMMGETTGIAFSIFKQLNCPTIIKYIFTMILTIAFALLVHKLNKIYLESRNHKSQKVCERFM